MASISQRLLKLIDEYRPNRLIVLGDLVHDRTAMVEARELLQTIRSFCEPIVVAGNHDRQLRGEFQTVESWQTDRFYFHHGHCAAEPSDRIQVIGHLHPAGTITDGAGLRLKCRAFVQQSGCWIVPAFSPWASGTRWRARREPRLALHA